MTDYYSIAAISNSSCTTFIDHGPEGYCRRYVERSWQQDEPSEAMRLGTAIHAVIVENRLPDDVCRLVPPDVLSSSGSRAGNAWKLFAGDNAGKLLLKSAGYEEFMLIVASIRGNSYARRLLDMESEREHDIVWHCETHDVDRKSRLDMLSATCIVDLKIVNDVSPRGFARLAYDRGYHRQAAFYRDAVRAKTGETLPFLFIAAQNCEPYSVACYDLGNEFLQIGAEQIDAAIDGIRRATERNDWKRPGCETLVTLAAPNYAKYANEYTINGDE